MPKSANTRATGRKAPKTAWKPGQSGNPKGAPKRGESWAEVLTEVGKMTPSQAIAKSFQIAGVLGAHKTNKVTLKELVALRVYTALIFEPVGSLFNAVMDRTEGRVPFPVDLNWREEIEKRGFRASEVFEAMVQAATARIAGEGGGRSVD